MERPGVTYCIYISSDNENIENGSNYSTLVKPQTRSDSAVQLQIL
jgi:hypothetical protein